jgi:DNA-binding beta-propeller fold protein YncE
MKKYIFFVPFIVICCSLLMPSCLHEQASSLDGGYPSNVATIFFTKCVSSGCHNAMDKDNAAGLDLSTWKAAFLGTEEHEAVIIPYYPLESHVFLHCNTFADLGDQITPRMPLDGNPLSREEMRVLSEWIRNGAPDKYGRIAFSENSNRSKIYVTNQGCDRVAVLDAASQLLMRYIPVGTSASIEVPHKVFVTEDGNYVYVLLSTDGVLQKIDAHTDQVVGSASFGAGNWVNFVLTKNGKRAFILDSENDGKVVVVNLATMSDEKYYAGAGLFVLPHGLCLSPDEHTLYILPSSANFVYKMDVTDPLQPQLPVEVCLVPGALPSFSAIDDLNFHEIAFSPDGTKYFVNTQLKNDVRVYNAKNDSLLAQIPIGIYPQEFAVSRKYPYLFVSCILDSTCTAANCLGAVSVIDYNTLQLVKTIKEGFYQPHGLVVDDANHRVYVASRNLDVKGPPPHHSAACSGRNGFISSLNIDDLQVEDYHVELSVDPYSVAIRR